MIWSASSNSWSLDSWLTSPVWMMKSGCCGIARILAIASPKVALGSGFAALLKPMWLSLTCTKVKGFVPAGLASAASRLIELANPPETLHTAPVPAQAMHLSRPLRLVPLSS